MKIYHTETREDYDALMVELEEQGCKWLSGNKPTSWNDWSFFGKETCVRLDDDTITQSFKSFYDGGTPITKYKAEADEKMRFTKENIEGLVNKYFDDNVGECPGNLIAEIYAMDDTPEKVVVKKFVAEFYEECANATLEFLITQLEATDSRSELGKWYRSCSGRHRNGRANAQEVIARMKLDGYTIAPEKLYYIPLPHLETSDGIQQVLSKRDTYFASRPNEKLKQRYTKAELERVPEVYKLYAKPIEEEEE